MRNTGAQCSSCGSQLLSQAGPAAQTAELPQLQTAAAAIAGAPAFATAFSSQLNAFAAAVGALPGAFVPATPDYPALGASLAALLPLVGAGSKTATVQGIEAGFNAFYAAKTTDTTGAVLTDVNGCDPARLCGRENRFWSCRVRYKQCCSSHRHHFA